MIGYLVITVVAVAKKSIPVFNSNSNSRVFNSNSIFNSTNFNSNSNSGIGIGIELQFQFRNWIDPNPALLQNIVYQIKRDVAVWKRLGCPQRKQQTWWQIVAAPYTGLA